MIFFRVDIRQTTRRKREMIGAVAIHVAGVVLS
jgi:hypothetical protein